MTSRPAVDRPAPLTSVRAPVRGPEDSRRKSLQILDSFTAVRLSMPENSTKAPMSEVASIKSAAGTSGWPLMVARRCTARAW